MRLLHPLLAAFLLHSSLAARPAKRSYDTHDYYVIEHIPHASAASLDDVLHALGVEFVEQAGELVNHWLVRTPRNLHDLSFREEPRDRVVDAFQALRVRAHSSSSKRSTYTDHAHRIVSSIGHLSKQQLRRRVKRAPPPIKPEVSESSRAVAKRLGIQDPFFEKQWHHVNDEFPEHMMNATPVWEMGYTGKGVISSLVDDGLDYTSDDLAANFDADDSHDFNDHEALPTPKNSDDHHGTRCAGQIAAVKNTVCGLGLAYESKVAGVRILSGPITDVDEATALNYGFQNVSIFSCSWGPPDNGMSMEGPGYLIKKAVVNGINQGRGGKGSIFVFASGNGAASDDQCNFDGYTNSIYSLTVAAIDYKGLHPYYSEACAANMVVAYSSGSGQHIVTTDKGKDSCATTHGGTSAAAPNAAGVFVLALQARPDLSWRDIQHLSVETARIVNPDDKDWEKTATGRLYSYKYGYGAIDAYAFVKAAESWTPVKSQSWIFTETVQLNGGKMPTPSNYTGGQFIGPGGVENKITVTQQMLEDNNFEKLEHVNVKVWIQHTRRGHVEVEIVSPNGIKSVLASQRQFDNDESGFPGWTFMSVKHWGEDPVGDWTIRVSDQNEVEKNNGSFLGWNMIFWGSAINTDKTRLFEVEDVEDVLPPTKAPMRPILPSASMTTQYTKPTSHLPPVDGDMKDENSQPSSPSASPDATATDVPTAPGWFDEMSRLLSNSKWFFGALSLVILFGVGVGVFFCLRRRKRREQSSYGRLANDDVSMAGLGNRGGNGRTRELYDAFGEVSEDEEDADETTKLRGTYPPGRSTDGLGFHSGFLDDEEPSTAGGVTPRREHYKDDSSEDGDDTSDSGKEKSKEEIELINTAGPNSPNTRTSGDGSWEHASSATP
ncbi:hypothetical protein AGABI2DRAFT_199236 [Agaricus bisporus var. bisporus H97]|uniref:hypothetical protein n=1 Tax=Agaricus bisporus var. bisporus (strain H97 / ATCC MYA-4626 / FGSC 10389) TaxID=936046 RepID=UPI00029F6711|nr:hypothetical protein AGABI2DRAFT_199236 [Agaricus bisporus var. bisporus H97]EKV49992.1 hypothetical protein AGABI2DRAFT_199236 [Agaricus bisporus var. bisporus H97]